MFIPTGGFGWVTGDHETAAPGTSEVLLSRGAASPAEVDATIEQARAAGGPDRQRARAASPGATPAPSPTPIDHLWEVIAIG